MPIELPPQYDPKSVEQAIYQRWLAAGAFHAVPDERPAARRFSVVIPPPNVTGALHLGHAINGTIQDVLTRYHRMKGDNTLWMPGIDHAGIATQAVVEKTIFEKEKKNRHDLGREELVRRIWEWKEQFGTRILNQLQSIGVSCDWERARFTLDEVCARAVREAFFKMFKDGLIFRGKRLVNWDTHLQTAVADDEIYHETVKGEMVLIKYPVADEKQEAGSKKQEEYLVVATTRAETMLGDTAVAVHPEDGRYKHLIGGHVIVPLVGRRIPIVADGLLVDPAFGTGVVKVTPAHDPNDYATGVRHGLAQINLLTADGKVNENGAGEFRGQKYSYVGLKFATAARKAVLADLEGLGLIVERKVHEHEVGHSDRSKTPIEPYLSDQWFVRMGDVGGASGTEGAGKGTGVPGRGTDGPGRGTEVPGRGTDGPGKGTDDPGKGTEVPGKGTDGPGRGTDGPGRGTEVPGRGTDGPGKGTDDPGTAKTAFLTSKTGVAASGNVESKGGIALANGTRASGLAQAAMDAVLDGRVKIMPERYAKGYLDWLGQKRDWCISRQLWWGHRIPVWTQHFWNKAAFDQSLFDLRTWMQSHSDEVAWQPEIKNDSLNGYGSIYVCLRRDDATLISDLKKMSFDIQDPDVLDTWFSSALWPISTMGWPAEGTSEKAEDQLLPYFYPTSVLSTAREILTLWVARMVMFGLYCRGDVPFKDVYIHAVIQDGEGRPMKKSLGNGVDPVDIVSSHGADALRFTLAAMATETQDIRMPVVKDARTGRNTSPKFDLGRNFANKIWNAARYILLNMGEISDLKFEISDLKALEDRWILSRLHQTIRAAEAAINAYRFADMAEALRSFFWTDLCDWYLEIAKSRIKSGDAQAQSVLLHGLQTALKLLHPVMPFISEELWSKLPTPSGAAGMLITTPWPQFDPARIDPAAESQLALIQSVTSAIREIQNRYPAAKGKDVILAPRDAATQQLIEQSRGIIEALAGSRIAENSPTAAKPENAAASVLPEAQIYIAGVIEKGAETAKLTKRQAELEKFIAAGKAKLANAAAVAKAPANVVQGWREQLAKQEEELAAVMKNLAELGS